MLKRILLLLSLVIIAACQSQIPTLSVDELMKDIEKSRPKPSKYNGKELTVRGYTYGVIMEGFGDVAGILSLEEKNGRDHITCFFGHKDAAEFSKIKGLQYVTVKATFDYRQPDLRSCTLVNIEPEANYPVEFVDRNAVISPNKINSPTPNTPTNTDVIQVRPAERHPALTLLVEVRDEVREDGKLYLNHEEAGHIYDLTQLTEKLKAVFQEREKQSTSEREVIIDAPGLRQLRLNELIERLAEDAKATPILIIKNNS